MHFLPLLLSAECTYRFPWTDEHVQQAMLAVLEEDLARRTKLWLGVLRDCPPLGLWSLCRNPAWSGAPPRHWLEIAQWLAAHGVDPAPQATLERQGPQGVSADPCREPNRGAVTLLIDAFRQPTTGASSWELRSPSAEDPWLAHGAAWLAASEIQGRDRPAEAAPPWLIQGWRSGGRASGLDVLRWLGAAARPSAWRQLHSSWLRREPLIAPALAEAVFSRAQLRAQLEAQFDARLQQEKLHSLKELAYGASHELNNPLANIAARAQTLLLDETDPDKRRKLESINRQAFRAHEMIADMMLFARPPRLQIENVDLSELVRSSVERMAELAQLQQTELRWDPAARPAISLPGDPRFLCEAVQALIRNALEAVICGGCVEVAVQCRPEPQQAVISVRDNGPGISASARQHLFDPFYSGREAGRGLGLGLSKTWRVISQHGGTIEVRSEPERGAEFFITLPLCKAA